MAAVASAGDFIGVYLFNGQLFVEIDKIQLQFDWTFSSKLVAFQNFCNTGQCKVFYFICMVGV